MQPITLLTGPLEVNTYIMSGMRPGECFLVDPSDAELVRDTMKDLGVKPTHILLTHGHFDHILGVAQLQKEFGAKVCIHAEEADALYDGRASLSVLAGMEVPPCHADVLWQGGETFEAAGFSIKVLHTPGHTQGGVCYLAEDPLRIRFSRLPGIMMFTPGICAKQRLPLNANIIPLCAIGAQGYGNALYKSARIFCGSCR